MSRLILRPAFEHSYLKHVLFTGTADQTRQWSDAFQIEFERRTVLGTCRWLLLCADSRAYRLFFMVWTPALMLGVCWIKWQALMHPALVVFILLGCLLNVGCALTRVDATVVRALWRHYDYRYLFISMLCYLIFSTWAQIGIYPVVWLCVQACVILPMALMTIHLDAVPEYPPAIKLVMLSLCVIWMLRLLLVDVIGDREYEDYAVCTWICVTTRRLANLCISQVILYLCKHLWFAAQETYHSRSAPANSPQLPWRKMMMLRIALHVHQAGRADMEVMSRGTIMPESAVAALAAAPAHALTWSLGTNTCPLYQVSMPPAQAVPTWTRPFQPLLTSNFYREAGGRLHVVAWCLSFLPMCVLMYLRWAPWSTLSSDVVGERARGGLFMLLMCGLLASVVVQLVYYLHWVDVQLCKYVMRQFEFVLVAYQLIIHALALGLFGEWTVVDSVSFHTVIVFCSNTYRLLLGVALLFIDAAVRAPRWCKLMWLGSQVLYTLIAIMMTSTSSRGTAEHWTPTSQPLCWWVCVDPGVAAWFSLCQITISYSKYLWRLTQTQHRCASLYVPFTMSVREPTYHEPECVLPHTFSDVMHLTTRQSSSELVPVPKRGCASEVHVRATVMDAYVHQPMHDTLPGQLGAAGEHDQSKTDANQV